MILTTFARTFRDTDEPHIARFLDSHAFCDKICLGVCQTSDKTLAVASRYPNVELREFNQFATNQQGETYAREGAYYAFLNDWANEIDTEIVIFDDVDHMVNPAMQRDARSIFESHPNTPFFYSLLVYIYGEGDYYFPELNNCHPSERLWAWNKHIWRPTMNPEPATTVEITNQPDARLLAGEGYIFPHPPYAVKHFSYLTEEIIQNKLEFNRKRGVLVRHPLDSCGHLDPLPDWV